MAVLRMLLAACLVVVFAAPSLAVEEETSETWRSIIQGVEKSIENQQKTLDAFHQEMGGLAAELNKGLAKADDRLNQILLLKSVAGETPWAYRTLANQFLALKIYVELKKQPLEQRKRTLLQSRQDYEELKSIETRSRKRRSVGLPGAKDLAEPVEELHDLKKEVLDAKDQINKALEPADKMVAQIEAAHNSTIETYYDTLATYYFTPSAALWSFEGLHHVKNDLFEWMVNTPRFWKPLITWVHWWQFYGNVLLFWILLFISSRYAVSRWILKKSNRFDRARVIGGLALWSLGISIFISLFHTYFTSNQLTMLLIPLLTTLGLQQFCRGFLQGGGATAEAALASGGAALEESGGPDGEPDEHGGAPAGTPAGEGADPAAVARGEERGSLFPLWVLMAVGGLWQVLNTPAMVLQVFWLICLGLAAWWIHVRSRGLPDSVERAMLRASLWVIGGLAVMSVFSLAPLALVLAQAWFMLLLTIQFLQLVRMGLFYLAERLEAKNGPRPSSRALRELVFPLAVLVTLYVYCVWALFYMGGPGFTKHVMRLDWTIGTVHLTFRGLAWILIGFFAVRLFLFVMRSGLEGKGIRGRRLNQAKAHTVSTVASYIIWVLFVLMGLRILGVSLGALTWIASGLSVGVGFGLKDIVNNFISGLIVMFGGNIKKGDIIQTDPKTMGEVVNVSVRNTIVRTLDNRTIIVPNQKFLSGEITNWSYKDKRLRLTLPISVVPGTKIKKMEKVLLKAAKKNHDVLSDPEPRVISLGFGQLGLDFQLHVWIDDFQKKYKVETALISAIDEGFQEKKIIPAFRTVKKKYKPKGSEQAQLEAQREALKEKRREVLKLFRAGGRRHVRRGHGLTDSPVPRSRGEE